MPVPNQPRARVLRKLEILGQLESVHRASVLAQPAEHAARCVIRELGQLLAPGLGVADAGDHNQLLRAGNGAEVATDAQGFVGVGVLVEPGSATVTLGDLRPLRRVLLGVDILRMLVPKGHPETLEQVDQKNRSQQLT